MSYRNLEFQIDLSVDSAHARVVRLVGTNKDVLDVGCATGYMARILVDQACRVTGIEQNREAAERAKKVCQRVIVGDVETLDLEQHLGQTSFDVIICADILEHLRTPAQALTKLAHFLSPRGYVIASIPNVGHVSVIAELLQGRFRYRPEGLLDETHLRFFTLDSIYELFESSGFVITQLERFRMDPAATEFRTQMSGYPPELIEVLLGAHPDSTTYQFIVRAHPTTCSGRSTETLKRVVSDKEKRTCSCGRAPDQMKSAPPQTRSEEEHSPTDAVISRMQFLENDRTWRARELDGLRHQLGEAENYILQLKGEIERRGDAVEALESEMRRRGERIEALENGIHRRDERIAALESVAAELALIKGSRAWKLTRRIQSLAEALFPRGSRRGRLLGRR